MPVILPWALLLLAQGAVVQDPPVSTGTDRWSAVRIQVTGDIDLHYLYRSPAIDTAGGVLNSFVPGTTGPDSFWAGRIGLRTDIEVKDAVTGVIELENRSYEKGVNLPFSAVNPFTPIEIKQGYIEVGQFLSPQVNLRIGVQNVTLRNRPQDEPFFMDLGESEGFFRGFQPAGSYITNSVDRDVGQATGVRLFYSPYEVMTLQAFWMLYGEGGSTPLNESVYAVVANSLLSELWSAWLLLAVVTGGGDRLGEIETLGLGVDGYTGDSKELELFLEAYVQGGTLQHAPAAVHKEAYAFNAGARYLGFFDQKLWVEAAVSRRSGDRHPGDDHDQAFQSYSNVNRFLILESSEFGLDVDTNVTCARIGAGVGPFAVDGRPLRIQADLGRFTAVAPIASVAALGNALRWGIETDLAATWAYTESLSFQLKLALLEDSRLLERLSGVDHAWMLLFGADLKF